MISKFDGEYNEEKIAAISNSTKKTHTNKGALTYSEMISNI